jgi:phosphatidate cytidylyltransferase
MISAAVMITVGALEIWLGGPSFAALVILLTAVMLWELARMTAIGSTRTPLIIAALGGISLLICLVTPNEFGAALLLVPALAFALTPRRDRRLSAALAAALMVAGYGLVTLRQEAGTVTIVWLVLVVIASDVMGYFAGRTLGGPKFWVAISPKKTWSGTIAGWFGAALVGLCFMLAGMGGWGLVILSPFVAFAGQMGDIAESWIKRRTGIKDSSSLIPGHGGLLDRFDAMTGALVLLMVLNLAVDLPLPPAVGG